MTKSMNNNALDELSTETQHLFTALSHPIMLEILTALHESPLGVTTIAEELECEISAISRRLNELLELNLVKYTRVGRNHIYRLTSAVQMQRDTDQWLIGIRTRRGVSIQITYNIMSP